MASISSGARCTSSIINKPSPESTKPAGSVNAARRADSSSRVTMRPPRAFATVDASVLLPTCLAP